MSKEVGPQWGTPDLTLIQDLLVLYERARESADIPHRNVHSNLHDIYFIVLLLTFLLEMPCDRSFKKLFPQVHNSLRKT